MMNSSGQPRHLPLVPNGAPAADPKTARISLTDRCDLACVYCRPSRSDGYLERRLDLGGWRTLITALRAAGVERVRITGGEPLLDPRVVDLVAMLAAEGFSDLALTTNGTQLTRYADRLRQAGLKRLTVSIDTLRPELFWRLTRGGDLAPVLAGIELSRGLGFDELKTNTVVLRGENDVEIEELTEWAWARAITPRFIELMRIGEGATLPPTRTFSAIEMLARIVHLVHPGDPTRDPGRGPAKYLRALRDPTLRVGFITGTTDTYCRACDRLRVASDGTLRPCLATNDGVSAMQSATQGDVPGVLDALRQAWSRKPDGESWKGCTEKEAASVSIRAIGG